MAFLLVTVLLFGTAFDGVVGFGRCFQKQESVLFVAENRVFTGSVFAEKTVTSPVLCGRECSMDERCKAINFNAQKNLCQLNNATRRQRPDKLCQSQGSVYFDEDEDTPLTSLANGSLTCPATCKELLETCNEASGVYSIYPDGCEGSSLQVYCDMETDGGGWIVFQRRQDGSQDFYRTWAEYQSGFGNLSGEFWLGNDNLVSLTSNGTWELRVDIRGWDGEKAWAKYKSYKVSGVDYTLSLGQYDTSSTAGDSLTYHNGIKFSTKDRDNDKNCAQRRFGAWWFKVCANAHLNGLYHPSETPWEDDGIQWYHWRPNYSLKACSMKMR